VPGNLEDLLQILGGRAPSNIFQKEDRLELVSVAVNLIRSHPWLGWGPDVSRLIALYSPFEDIKNLTQFHNGYLQVLVHFGAVGVLLITLLIGAIILSAFRNRALAAPVDRLSPALSAGLIALVGYTLIANFAETILYVGPIATICMFACAVACMKPRIDPVTT
jgi:O-antigen ligase